jgi:hypothetical protein
MKVPCPVCGQPIVFNVLPAREEGVTHCKKCGLHAEASLRKDKHGRVWTITMTEEPKAPPKKSSSGFDSFLYAIYIMIFLSLFIYFIYLVLNS